MKVKYIILLVFAGVCMTSCQTVKQVAVHKEIPVITESRLLKNIYVKELDYTALYAKRIDVSLAGKESGNFRVALKIKRDSFIQASVSLPLGIEIARVLLTQDSIKFLDVFHKKYFVVDYRYFDDKFDAHVSFDCFQKILTNTFFNFENCSGIEGKDKKYKLNRLDDSYELSTVEEKALSRKMKKLYKKKRKDKDYMLILQKILIDPQTFRPLSMSIEDIEEGTGVSVNYKDFKDYNGKMFPEKIVFNLFSDKNKTSLELKFSKLEFDVDIAPNFIISSKYKRIQ